MLNREILINAGALLIGAEYKLEDRSKTDGKTT